jgi:glycosyltransferase involved in cell wall biosynthesis
MTEVSKLDPIGRQSCNSPIVHVLSGLEKESGGPSYSILRLVTAINGVGQPCNLYTVGEAPAVGASDAPVQAFTNDFASIPPLARLRFSNGLRAAIDAAGRAGSLIHTHGLWHAPNLYPLWSALETKAPLVLSPRGMLSPAALELGKLRKRAFHALVQRPALRSVGCFHATSEAEAADIRASGLKASIAIMPNGIDIPSGHGSSPIVDERRTAMYFGRLHPIKGLDRLLQAWAKAGVAQTGWRLRIIGPAEDSYRASLSAQAASLGLDNVQFEGAVFGDAKFALYDTCDLFILPSHSENFGVAAAEALSCGVPVVAAKGTPWAGLITQQCGWWTANDVDALTLALVDALKTPRSTLREMGARGRAWMQADFAWPSLARQMTDLYHWIRTGSDRPGFVHVD